MVAGTPACPGNCTRWSRGGPPKQKLPEAGAATSARFSHATHHLSLLTMAALSIVFVELMVASPYCGGVANAPRTSWR